jgi:capsular polysaccharide transport system permease protein
MLKTAPERPKTDRATGALARLIRPAAQAAAAVTPRRRPSGPMTFFLLIVMLPVLLASAWVFLIMADQYESEFRYMVRRATPPVGAMPGVASMASGSVPQMAILADSEMLVQYTRSRAAVIDISQDLDLEAIYTRSVADWWSRMTPGLPVEDRTRHWRRFVTASLDLNSSVVTVNVRAFTAADSQAVATALLAASERLVNDVSRRAQEDALALANREVNEARATLEQTRAALAAFRNRHEIVTPQMQAQIQSGVLARMRETLAEARASLAAQLENGLLPNTPQARLMRNRIAAIEREMEAERAQIGSVGGEAGARSTLASVLATYAELEGNERLALANYERALGAQSRARIEAMAQAVYLNTFIRPAEPERSTHPRRWWVVMQITLVCLAVWAILGLAWRTIRDQHH